MEFDRRTFVKGAAATAAFLPSFSILRAEDKDITIGPKDDDINVAIPSLPLRFLKSAV